MSGATLHGMATGFSASPEVVTRQRSSRQRGFALLVVLWTLGLLSLLIVGLAARARSTTSVAVNVRGTAVAEVAADGAVQQAIFQLGRGGWPLDTPPHRIVIGQATVYVAVDAQSGRINPNVSPPELVTGLLDRIGLEPPQALVLSRALIDWRTISPISLGGGLKVDGYQRARLPYGPPGHPFTSVDELGLVLGMNADVLARLRPYVSVYQRGDGRETASNAVGGDISPDSTVTTRGASLIDLANQEAIVRIRATAVLANGTQFVRDTVVRLIAQAKPGERAWQVLTWD